jgi:hypothetical protein
MKTGSFTLRSGAKLTVTGAPFEAAIALVEAVKRVTVGRDPNEDVGDMIVMNPDVRSALFGVFDTVLYDTVRVTAALFDDPKLGEKARGDYFEICERVIEVNCRPFFLKTSSASTTASEDHLKRPGSV